MSKSEKLVLVLVLVIIALVCVSEAWYSSVDETTANSIAFKETMFLYLQLPMILVLASMFLIAVLGFQKSNKPT
jgi:hypothetical protein